MGKNSIFREFFRYVGLNVLGMIGLSCYILADTYFVSKALGTSGLAALNLAISVYSVINATGLMMGAGGGTRFSIFMFQGHENEARQVYTRTVGLALAAGGVFLLAGLFCLPLQPFWGRMRIPWTKQRHICASSSVLRRVSS